MNVTEAAAWRWLIAAQGYTPDTLVFQRRATPDFLGADGRGWEVKLIRANSIVFAATQPGPLRTHGNCFVLAWIDGADAPAAVMSMRRLQIPGYWKQYRLSVVNFSKYRQNLGHTVNITEEMKDLIDAGAARVGQSRSEWINDMIHEAISLQAARGGQEGTALAAELDRRAKALAKKGTK